MILKEDNKVNFKGARAIMDRNVLDFMAAILNKPSYLLNSLHDEKIQSKFSKLYVEWINKSRLNQFYGLNRFKKSCFSLGTSQSFDSFYLKHRHRRMRCFKGEYLYHQITWKNLKFNWSYIDIVDQPIKENDAVVVSLPFADSGNKHPQMDHLLDCCNKKKVPVLIDCAFFGICKDLIFNFSQPCIENVTFSLSKTFPVAHMRIGMRLSRIDDDDPLFFFTKENYTNRIGMAVGYALLNKFSADYNQERYGNLQIEICKKLIIKPSNCVLFGLGGKHYNTYSRSGLWNRLSLVDFYENNS